MENPETSRYFWLKRRRLTVILAGLTLLVFILTAPGALSDAYERGGIYLFSREFYEDIPKRLVGPGKFRFVLQPLLAIILGILNGVADARTGKPPYLFGLLFKREFRREFVRSGFENLANLLLMSILMDAVFQWFILGVSHPGAALLAGPVLILSPYAIARALANRMARLLKRIKLSGLAVLNRKAGNGSRRNFNMFEIIYRYDPNYTRELQMPANAVQALRRLEEGNQAFAAMANGEASGSRIVHMDVTDIGISGIPAQKPFAVVLGCADARVPTEMIFDRTTNEMFVVRVAGNIISQELLGSIDYAVEHLGECLKLIVVLGHSQCGAVTAAVNAFLTPAEYLGFSTYHHLRSIINILFPAVRGAQRALSISWGNNVSKMPGYREALIECSVVMNAALMASILQSEFDDSAQDRRVVFGVYDLASRRVHVPLALEDGKEPSTRLMKAPKGREQFRVFALQVVSSPVITRILHQEEEK